MAKIEVTSFVSPKAIPALRDAEIVLREIERKPGVVYSALVPNVRGAERAIEARADELNLVMSASESHNLANLRMTREQSFAALSEVARWRGRRGVPVNVSLSCCFGCPMEGDVPEATVLDWCAASSRRWARAASRCATPPAWRIRAQVARADASRSASAGRRSRADAALPQHARHGPGQRAGGDRCRRRPLRCVARRHRRLPVRARARPATCAARRSCTRSSSWATTPASISTRLIEAAKRLPALIGHDIPSQIVKAGRRLDLHPPPADFDAIRERALARDA